MPVRDRVDEPRRLPLTAGHDAPSNLWIAAARIASRCVCPIDRLRGSVTNATVETRRFAVGGIHAKSDLGRHRAGIGSCGLGL